MIKLTERDDRVKLAARCNNWLTELPRELSVRAVVTGSLGSVVFGYDDAPSFQTEKVSPYALGGDSPAGDYNLVTIGVGVPTLIAIPFAGMAGGGAAGGNHTVIFEVLAHR